MEQADPEIKRKLIGVLTVLFPHAKIYLFGSRAWGKARPLSDFDLAIDESKKIDRLRIGEAHGMFEGSNFPMKIDIVDLQTLPESWIDRIKKEGILWKS
ncbi:MAG: polymerase, beta domain protein region protein [candidate division TM6 bacterium GW2011_GWE2_42_60]|nr:MAG: polymerase, beta domain protein region protein [candidate division TM6 bacterium GW2011_GWE2_42_60]HBY06238.1 hypothetical protein [Candidatus Dependentiae bacterium]